MQQEADDKRWVIGPFFQSVLGITGYLPSALVLRQSGKIRAVDDFSQYLINSAVTCHKKLDLGGIDSICATARFFLGAPSGDGRWEIPDENSAHCGDMAAAWKGRCASDLYGRCLDLKHAYKQLGRNRADNWSSVLAVANPHDGAVYFFEAVALLLGAVSSVLAFNRVARALRMVMSRLFKLVVTNFFDDFCQLEVGLLRSSARSTAEVGLVGLEDFFG